MSEYLPGVVVDCLAVTAVVVAAFVTVIVTDTGLPGA